MAASREVANAIRVLAMDAVQKAKSGHPGAPMGMADIAEVLWRRHLKHNPQDPTWADRDRFVLSNGHGSMLLYSLLHLTGYDLTIDDLKNFRQLHSRTPGHPEYGYAPGVETTTGPLGQGISNAVGMAMAEKVLAAQFNREGHEIVNHYTYAFMGDGCMMEGISHEACALAGTLKLGKLITFWDDNGISIDGHVEGWFTDDTAARFKAYGWHVIAEVDGHDPEAVHAAIEEAKSVTDRPTLIGCKTIIGFGAPNKCGSHDCHGAPLGDEEISVAREHLGWDLPPFDIPDRIYAEWDAREQGSAQQRQWDERFAAYQQAFPDLAAEFKRRSQGELPQDFIAKADAYIEQLQSAPAKIASRKASQNTLNSYGPLLPELLGGSADLAPSNLTIWDGSRVLTADNADANYIHYGVREFGMSAIMNGMAAHGGFIPYGATFLMFMEYARNAVRMAALMKLRVLFVYTHDSIGLGEDGPTHQPVEQLATLRLTPNLYTWRPCDQVESAVAWKMGALCDSAPSALIFSRQGLEQQARTPEQVKAIEKGGYILSDSDGEPDLILIATGSEVTIAVAAAEQLRQQGRAVRVVSLPCTELFDEQEQSYREQVLPARVTKRVAIEAGIKDYWFKYVGLDGAIVGMSGFGESAPADELYQHFGITADAVVTAAQAL